MCLKSISWQTLPAPQQTPPPPLACLAAAGFLSELLEVEDEAEEVLLTMVPILNAGNQLGGGKFMQKLNFRKNMHKLQNASLSTNTEIGYQLRRD